MVVCDGFPDLPTSTLTHGAETALVIDIQNVVVAALTVGVPGSHPLLALLTAF
jgi:hypothetical protein